MTPSHPLRGHPLAIVQLAGDEREMGEQHGEITRALGDWEEALALYRSFPERILSGGHRGAGRGLALKLMAPLLARGLTTLERARPTALADRTRRFLRALGRPEGDARFILILDLIQNALGVLARAGVAPDVRVAAREVAASFPGACSSFAAWGEASEDGRLLHGRNFDLPGVGVWERRPEVVFNTPPDDLRYGFGAPRRADVPGGTPLNEAGITLTAHTRFHRAVRFDGLGIVDLGHLIARRAKTLAEAIAIATSRPIASTWGLFVSSARERSAVSLEIHAGRVAVVPPSAAWHTCTNRYRTPVMQRGEISPSPAWIRYSEGRQGSMERSFGRASRIKVAGAKALLGSREAGDTSDWSRATGDTLCQTISIQSVVVDPDREVIHVGCGDAPTSLGPWQAVPWRWSDTPGVEIVQPGQTQEAPAAPRWPGFEAFMAATRLEGDRAPIGEVDHALARALAEAPSDPSYLHLAGGSALRLGRPAEALAHFEAALEAERSDFRRGELHLWAMRAAAAADRGPARSAHRRALSATTEPHLAPAREAARRGVDRRDARAYRDLAADFQLLTLAL